MHPTVAMFVDAANINYFKKQIFHCCVRLFVMNQSLGQEDRREGRLTRIRSELTVFIIGRAALSSLYMLDPYSCSLPDAFTWFTCWLTWSTPFIEFPLSTALLKFPQKWTYVWVSRRKNEIVDEGFNIANNAYTRKKQTMCYTTARRMIKKLKTSTQASLN